MMKDFYQIQIDMLEEMLAGKQDVLFRGILSVKTMKWLLKNNWNFYEIGGGDNGEVLYLLSKKRKEIPEEEASSDFELKKSRADLESFLEKSEESFKFVMS